MQRRFLLRLEIGPLANAGPEIRLKLDELGEYLQQAIDRIPPPTTDEIMEAGMETAYGSTLVLNKWARLLIATYLDQRFCLFSYPMSRIPHSQEWDEFYAEYGALRWRNE